MAITINNVQTKVVESDVNSISWTHTCSGEDRLLLVFIGSNIGCSSITYNGVGMTLVDTQVAGAGNRCGQIWKLVNPSTGSAYTITANLSSLGFGKAYSVSFDGVNQTTPLNAVAKGQSSGTAVSATATTVSGGIVCDLVVAVGDASSVSFTPGSGQTERLDSNSISYMAAAGSTISATTTSKTMTQTISRSLNWGYLVVCVMPKINIKKIIEITRDNIKKIDSTVITSIKRVAGVSNI